jgi:hypothetical protein
VKLFEAMKPHINFPLIIKKKDRKHPELDAQVFEEFYKVITASGPV